MDSMKVSGVRLTPKANTLKASNPVFKAQTAPAEGDKFSLKTATKKQKTTIALIGAAVVAAVVFIASKGKNKDALEDVVQEGVKKPVADVVEGFKGYSKVMKNDAGKPDYLVKKDGAIVQLLYDDKGKISFSSIIKPDKSVVCKKYTNGKLGTLGKQKHVDNSEFYFLKEIVRDSDTGRINYNLINEGGKRHAEVFNYTTDGAFKDIQLFEVNKIDGSLKLGQEINSKAVDQRLEAIETAFVETVEEVKENVAKKFKGYSEVITNDAGKPVELTKLDGTKIDLVYNNGGKLSYSVILRPDDTRTFKHYINGCLSQSNTSKMVDGEKQVIESIKVRRYNVIGKMKQRDIEKDGKVITQIFKRSKDGAFEGVVTMPRAVFKEDGTKVELWYGDDAKLTEAIKYLDDGTYIGKEYHDKGRFSDYTRLKKVGKPHESDLTYSVVRDPDTGKIIAREGVKGRKDFSHTYKYDENGIFEGIFDDATGEKVTGNIQDLVNIQKPAKDGFKGFLNSLFGKK